MNIEQKSREVVSKLEQDGWVEPGSAGINVCWAIAVALQSAVAEEREECAKLMEYNPGRTARWLAAAIRARGQKDTA